MMKERGLKAYKFEGKLFQAEETTKIKYKNLKEQKDAPTAINPDGNVEGDAKPLAD